MNLVRFAVVCAAIIVAVQEQLVFAQHQGTCRRRNRRPHQNHQRRSLRPSPSPPAAEPAEAGESMHMDHGIFVMHDDQMFIRAGEEESNLVADVSLQLRHRGAYTAGGARDVWNTEKTSLAIGSDVTFYSKPSILDSIYGSNPVSWKLFVRLRPAQMTMVGMHGTH